MSEKGWTKSETDRSFAELAIHLDGDLEGLITIDESPTSSTRSVSAICTLASVGVFSVLKMVS